MSTKFEPSDGAHLDFDEALAAELVGCTMLVGVTYVDASDRVIEQKQVVGKVKQCTLEEGLTLVLQDGSEFDLPPATSWIEPAAPGEYRLRSTGEVVVDPDFLFTVTSTKPSAH